MEKQKPKPIVLIASQNNCSQQNQHNFIINQQAIKLIKSIPGPMSIISICGQHRSGKSFLLNSLFFSGKGFDVSSTTQACTKGLIIWNQPLKIRGINIWIIDTQGFGSIDKDSDYDGKIFLLCTLLSNILIYNSFGPIDQNSLEKFILMCQTIKIKQPQYNPIKLYWILRDFSLSMEDKDGQILTSNQYLNNSLKIKNYNSIIEKMFIQKYCIPLIRPTINQQKLNNLSNIQMTQLRPQFVDQIYKFRKKLFSSITPKIIKDQQLNGDIFSILIDNYIKLLNLGKIQCNLNVSWQVISNYKCQKVFDIIFQNLKIQLQNIRKILPLTKQQISKLKKDCLNNYCQQFKKKASNFYNYTKLEIKLKQDCNKLLNFLEIQNNQYINKQIKTYLQIILNQSTHKLINILALNNFPNKYFQQLLIIKQNLKNKYQKYQNIDIIYYQKSQQFIKIILDNFSNKIKKIDQDRNKKIQDYKKLQKKLENQLKNIKEKQYQKQQINLKNKNKIIQKQNIIQNLKRQIQQNNKNKKIQRQQFQKQIHQKNQIIQKYQQQITKIKRNQNWQINQLNQNIKLLTNKNQLLQTNLKQYQQKIIDSTKKQQQIEKQYKKKLEINQDQKNKLGSQLLKYQQNLMNERNKSIKLIEQRKNIQKQLIIDISNKNQKLLDLKKQFNIKQKNLTQEFKNILIQQKIFNQQKINNLKIQCQNYKKQLQIYYHKFEQEINKSKNNQKYQKLIQQYGIEIKQNIQQIQSLKQILKSKTQQYNNNKIKQQQLYQQMKISLQNQIKQLQQQIINFKKLRNQQNQKYNDQFFQYNLLNKKKQQQYIQKMNQKFNKIQTYYQLQINQMNKIHQTEIQLIKQQVNKCYIIIQQLNSDINKIIHQKQNIMNNFIELKNQSKLYKQQKCQFCYQSKNQTNQLKGQIEKLIQKYNQSQQKYKENNNQLIQLKKQLINYKNNQQKQEIQTQQFNKQNKQIIQNLLTDNNKLKEEIQQERHKYQMLTKKIQSKHQQLILKDDISNKKQQMYQQSLQLYKDTINKLRNQNHTLREKNKKNYQKLLTITPISQIILNKTTIQQNKQQQNNQLISIKIQYQTKINKLQSQLSTYKQLLDQKQKIHNQNIKINKIINYQENYNQNIQYLKNQNQQLRNKIQKLYLNQINELQLRKTSKNYTNGTDIDQSRIKSLKQQLNHTKNNFKKQIQQMQQIIQNYTNQKYALKQQINILKSQIDRRGYYTQKILQQQINMLKKQKISYQQANKNQLKSIEQTLNKKIINSQQKIQEFQHKYKQLKNQNQKQKIKLQLQCDRNKAKYQHLLKVNNQLLLEIQALKNKNGINEFKQKYKQKISNLFF